MNLLRITLSNTSARSLQAVSVWIALMMCFPCFVSAQVMEYDGDSNDLIQGLLAIQQRDERPLSAEAKKYLENMLKRYDLDSNGILTATELEPAGGQGRAAIAESDSNGDGRLSTEELAERYRKRFMHEDDLSAEEQILAAILAAVVERETRGGGPGRGRGGSAITNLPISGIMSSNGSLAGGLMSNVPLSANNAPANNQPSANRLADETVGLTVWTIRVPSAMDGRNLCKGYRSGKAINAEEIRNSGGDVDECYLLANDDEQFSVANVQQKEPSRNTVQRQLTSQISGTIQIESEFVTIQFQIERGATLDSGDGQSDQPLTYSDFQANSTINVRRGNRGVLYSSTEQSKWIVVIEIDDPDAMEEDQVEEPERRSRRRRSTDR